MLFKSDYTVKYFDSFFILKVKKHDAENQENVIISKSFAEFKQQFNNHLLRFLVENCNLIYEALSYLKDNNFYGTQTKKYMALIANFVQIHT